MHVQCIYIVHVHCGQCTVDIIHTCIHVHVHQCFFRNIFRGGGQTNISRNRGGHRLQLKSIKLKLTKAQGGQDHFQGGGGGGGGGRNAPLGNTLYIHVF